MSESCWVCGGDGIYQGEECRHCEGDGIYVKHSPANVVPSHIVLEAIDATEHNALTDAQKDGVLHILECGFVDLNEGKVGITRLLNWFGAESTTIANLQAMIT